jgi:hypothetical protein
MRARERRQAMSEHEFTLVIEGDLTNEEVVRALFEAGCDDATFGVVDGVGYGEFVREASSFSAAVLSAIHEVDSVLSLRVRRVEPDDIVTMAEIAERLDRTRESVRLLIEGKRGPGGFPPPISHGRERGRLWRWSDVADWLDKVEPEEREAAHFVAAVNGVLELRHSQHQMADEVAVKELLSLV